jgi:hypothetical protein
MSDSASAAATETFNDPIRPRIGIRTTKSALLENLAHAAPLGTDHPHQAARRIEIVDGDRTLRRQRRDPAARLLEILYRGRAFSVARC